MKTIVILEGSETIDEPTLAALNAATQIIGTDGTVVGNKAGETGWRVNIEELNRVLVTKARVRKGAGHFQT